MADWGGGGDGDTIVTVIITVMVLVVIFPVFYQAVTIAGSQSGSESIEYPDGEYTLDASSGEPDRVEVLATTENAVRLDGTGGVSSPAPDAVNMSWSVCATGKLEASDGAAYTLVALNNESVHLMRDSGNWGIYRNNGTHDAYVTVPAGAGLDPVCAVGSPGSVSLHSNEGSASANLTTATSARPTAWSWEGRVDEVRVFNSSIDPQPYLEDQAQPLPGTQRTARLMLDEGEGGDTRVYFANTTATLSGHSWAAGVENPGTVLGIGAISEGDDYEFSYDPLTIRIVDSGYLDGAPVVHVRWGMTWLPFDISSTLALLGAALILVYVASAVTDRV
jgi:hypothetical protein